jgi:two-component system, chemotaxis family, sensor kinase CheA
MNTTERFPMTGTMQTDSAKQQEQLLNEFAAQIVCAGNSDADGNADWVATLDRMIGGDANPPRPRIPAEAASLQTQLLALSPGSRAFFEAAEAGIERLRCWLEEQPPEMPTQASSESSSIAQDPELIADFVVEAREHLRSIEQNVLAVEQDSGQMDPIHAMFRAFHTIKGIAGFLEFQAIRDVSHETETLLDLARNGNLTLLPAVIDVILESADYLNGEISRIEAGGAGESAPSGALIARLGALSNREADPSEEPAEHEEPSGDIQLQHDFQMLAEALSDPGSSEQREVLNLPESKSGPSRRKGLPAATSIKVDTAKLDFLVDAIGEMVIAQSLIRHNTDLAKMQSASLMRNVAQLSRITGEVQKTAMSMRMVPIGTLFQKMTRLVRDLCRKSGKQAELVTWGDETELDRNIVEELADPLMHMLRNALDHGIESPEQRSASGKPATARVELRAAHQGGHILIEIVDDGRGINRNAVLRKAVERGLVHPEAQLSDTEVFALIFEPGFSTAEKVTDISGRGVGMDVVKKHIQKLRGTIETHSTPGKGTTFRLKLPLTLAIIDGLVVGVGQERYIVPIFAVKEMLRPAAGMVSTIEGAREIALIRDRVLPVVRLHKKFGIEPATEEPTESLLIMAESQEAEFCLLVDKLIGKQEVVIKSLGESLKNIPGIAGGAILDDGRVALILEMNALFHSSRAA